jgi:hypothetical protein
MFYVNNETTKRARQALLEFVYPNSGLQRRVLVNDDVGIVQCPYCSTAN